MRIARGLLLALTLPPLLVALTVEEVRANALPDHLLPWDYGVGQYVSQGNNQGTHVGLEQYAWDFAGSWPVRAAATGTVLDFKDGYSSSQGGCGQQYANYANYVIVQSGTYVALYLHLAQGSVTGKITIRGAVSQDTVIGTSDSTGWVCGSNPAHLHYMVETNCGSWYCQSVASSFSDSNVLSQDSDGIPLTGQTVVSSNQAPLVWPPAGPVIEAFSGASELIAAPGSGSSAGMKLARNDTLTNPYGWSSFGAFNPASVTFSGTPTELAYSTYVVVFAIGSDGGLWIWYYDSGTNPCPNSAWCTAHALGGQLSQSSGIGLVSHTNILQVFAIGSNGSLQEYADSSPTCSNGSLYPAYNSWCNPAPIPGATTPLSLTSRVAVTEYAGYMQVFAVDVNGAMEHYAGACQGNDGWCTPYPLANIGILTLSTSSGVAVVAYSGYMQLFALSYSGYLEEFSGACTPPPGQPYKVFCAGGALPGVLLSTNSGVAALVFGTHMQVFAIEPNGLLDEYSGACPPGPNGYQGWCPPFNNGGQLKPASDIGEMIWNGSMQVFAVGSDSSIQFWSGTGGETPDNCDGVGDGSNGWCNPKSLGTPFIAV